MAKPTDWAAVREWGFLLYHHWVSNMTTGVIPAVVAFVALFSGGSPARWLGGIALVLIFIHAAYDTWKDERNRADATSAMPRADVLSQLRELHRRGMALIPIGERSKPEDKGPDGLAWHDRALAWEMDVSHVLRGAFGTETEWEFMNAWRDHPAPNPYPDTHSYGGNLGAQLSSLSALQRITDRYSRSITPAVAAVPSLQ